MREVRSQMEENEQLSVLMAGFRGSNLNDSDFARSAGGTALMGGSSSLRGGCFHRSRGCMLGWAVLWCTSRGAGGRQQNRWRGAVRAQWVLVAGVRGPSLNDAGCASEVAAVVGAHERKQR